MVWDQLLYMMKTKSSLYHELVQFIQLRMHEKIQTLDAKVEVITTQWNNNLYVWYQKALKAKDEVMKNLINTILLVKP